MLYFIDKNSEIKRYKDLEEYYLLNSKKRRSWKKSKSAESLARYWLEDNQKEFYNLLGNLSSEIEIGDGYFEYNTTFDQANTPRTHDLCFPKAKIGKNNCTICIEAKADEPYDELISKKWHIASNKRLLGENTDLDKRIKAIYDSICINKNSETDEQFRSLRYQLFTGLVGTIAEARKNNSSHAIFIIHQFDTATTKKDLITRNKIDLNNFLRFLLIGDSISSGELLRVSTNFKDIDDFKIKYYLTDDIRLYIGYLYTNYQ